MRTGKIKHALILHPDDTHIIYPLGSTIVIKNVEDPDDQIFLQGVCCCCSRLVCHLALDAAALPAWFVLCRCPLWSTLPRRVLIDSDARLSKSQHL